jgi:hypothetical protein
MKITIIGTRCVARVFGARLAEFGNDPLCVDDDEAELAMLNKCDVPIFEPMKAYYTIGRDAARVGQSSGDAMRVGTCMTLPRRIVGMANTC